MEQIHEDVQSYYGDVLEKSSDLKTNACCTIDRPAAHIREVLSMISDEVQDKYYGCGLTIPSAVEDLHILDLGSGSGRDCFIASKLCGAKGSVMGIDMTDAQLDVARRNIDYHTEKYGYVRPNVEFRKGNIDKLDQLQLGTERFDLVISNCVINLVMDKQKVLSDVFEVLKLGGELYFSDVYSDRRIPQNLQQNKVLWGECLSGALYWNDFLKMAKKAGFTDPRVVESHPITIENEEIEELVGDIKFFSVTYRLMKINGLEEDCEDYGQAVVYKGGVIGEENTFKLDDHHIIPKGKVFPVCGNTYRMLHDTRYRKYFDFIGSWDTHFGIFEGCGANMPFSIDGNLEGSSGSCC